MYGQQTQSNEFSALLHLAAATTLRGLHIQLYPSDFISFWPDALPALTSLHAIDLPQQPPTQWQYYLSLERLDLSGMQCHVVPDWFSTLSKLERLSFDDALLAQFPLTTLHLSNLKHLSICGIHPPLQLPASILRFVTWPHLSCLGLSLRSMILTALNLNPVWLNCKLA